MPLFLVVRRVVRTAGRYREIALVAVAVLIVLIGAGLFSLAEHVSYGIGLYWSVTTATTVGYGDVTPHNTAGRVIAGGVMLTTIPIVGAVFALVAGASALSRIRRFLGMEPHLPQDPYTIVFGNHAIVTRVVQDLRRAGDPVVVVSPTQPSGVADDIEYIGGDPADDAVIRRTEPARAGRALIACTNDADTLVIGVTLHHLAPDLEVYALTQSARVAGALADLGITHTLASDELVGHTIAKSLETPEAGDILLKLVDNESFRMADETVDDALVSRPLSEARATAGKLVLGIARRDGVDLGVGDDPVLNAGDRLIVIEPC